MSLKVIDKDGEIRSAPRNLSSDLFIEFDRKDEQQIMAEIQGAAIEEFIYEFQQGGQKVTGLALAGVMAVAQNMGGITCGQPVWNDGTDHEDGTATITCDISATDHKTGMTVWGDATQRWYEKRRDGKTAYDRFARSKALSKAQRNAIRKLIPEKLATQMIKQFRQGSGGQQSRPPARPPRQQPPAQIREVNQDTGEVIDVQPASTNEPTITDGQVTFISTLAERIGFDEAALEELMSDRYGRTLHGLSKANASDFIDHLQAVTKGVPTNTEDDANPGGITPNQTRAVHGIAKKQGMEHAELNEYSAGRFGKAVKELTKEEASDLIADLQAL